MSEDTVTKGAPIPAETAEVLGERLDHGEWSEYVRSLADILAYGDADTRTPFDAVIENKQDALSEARRRRDDINIQIKILEDELETLKRERENHTTKAEQFDGALWQLEQDFRSGQFGHAVEDQIKIKNLASKFGRSTEAIITLLRERNPDVPEHAFKPPAAVRKRFSGLEESRVSLPVEKRE